MNSVIALLAVAVAVTSAQSCFDQQVYSDQHYDDSWVCKTCTPYPEQQIEADLAVSPIETVLFLDTSSSCFNETDYFSRSHSVAGDYAYDCVCPSPRHLVEKVYVQTAECYVVRPYNQAINYAQCGGHCTFDYRTEVAGSRGYYCVPQSFVQREFLVWCETPPHGAQASASGLAASGAAHTYGTFLRVSQNLPTLCSCRGYFCTDHVARAMHANNPTATVF